MTSNLDRLRAIDDAYNARDWQADGRTQLQRIAAARGAMNGLMADLIEEQLRTLQFDGDNGDAREAIEETIDVVHA